MNSGHRQKETEKPMQNQDYSQNIEIRVETAYLPEQSEPESHRFVFSYQISITNHNDQSVQLLSRRWRITDGNEHVQEVEGEGVLPDGHRRQPALQCPDSSVYPGATQRPALSLRTAQAAAGAACPSPSAREYPV